MADLPWLPEVLYGGPIEANEESPIPPSDWSLDGFFFRSIEQIVRQALDEEGRQDVSFEISFYGGTDGPDEHECRADMAAAVDAGDDAGNAPARLADPSSRDAVDIAPDAERLPGETVTYHFGPSDNGCYTLPNGDCVSEGPCMHSAPDAERLVERLRDLESLEAEDELRIEAADALEQIQAFHGAEMAALEAALSEARGEVEYERLFSKAEFTMLRQRAEKADAENAQLRATCVAESKRMAGLMERAEKAEANTEKEVHDRISEYVASIEAIQSELGDALATIENQFRPKIERMQKALRQIANAPDSTAKWYGGIARAALKEPTEEQKE